MTKMFHVIAVIANVSLTNRKKRGLLKSMNISEIMENPNADVENISLGVNNVKFTGEVLTNTKIARYQVDMKRLIKRRGSVVGLANGILYADSKKIYEAENLKVGLFKS